MAVRAGQVHVCSVRFFEIRLTSRIEMPILLLRR